MGKTKGDRKIKIKSSRNLKGAGKLGWTEGGKLKKTLVKLEKAESLEKEAIPLSDTLDNVVDTMKLEIDFPL